MGLSYKTIRKENMKLFKGKNKDFNLIRFIALKHGIIVNPGITIKQLNQLIKRKVN